jgi:acetylornithine deacetylase/succinyl-diaminopimelate desuccinylase-like protein
VSTVTDTAEHSSIRTSGDEAVHAFLAEHLPHLVTELSEWVRIPSVAGSDRDLDVLRSAHWLAGTLTDVGFPRVELWRAGTSPAVFAEWISDPSKPTVLVYSHHDVRAVKDGDWEETAPFEPVERRGRLYGRGASDAKGQVIAHLWGLRAHLRDRDEPAVNLKVIVEGEEELGSPGFAALLDEHRTDLAADVVVFSDTVLWAADAPAVCTSVRGMISASIEVHGPAKDVHSGAASGSVPNPALETGRLLGSLVDPDGRIAVPGFYDVVPPIAEERRQELAALPFTEEDWLVRSHSRVIAGEPGFSVLEQLWERPSVEVTSMISGDPVGPSRAAIPAVADARLSFRTVSGQVPERLAEQIRSWVQETLPDTVEAVVEVAEESAQLGYRTPPGPALDALVGAMRRGFQAEEVGRMGNAGGGPAELLARVTDAPLVFFGTGLIEDDWHDSDESAHLATLQAGAATMAFLWEMLPAALRR